MGNAPRKAAYPKSASSVGSATKKVRWGVGLGMSKLNITRKRSQIPATLIEITQI